MPRGLPHHLDLTVTDLARSVAFYDIVLGALGYERSADYAGDVPCWCWTGTSERRGRRDAQDRRLTEDPCFSIGLHVARSAAPHDRHAAGLHHLALHAASRAEVDAFHDLLVREGLRVLDAPAAYDYTPGYYAVFFADPDGLKLELVHEPR